MKNTTREQWQLSDTPTINIPSPGVLLIAAKLISTGDLAGCVWISIQEAFDSRGVQGVITLPLILPPLTPLILD